jgi:hypothetical protein
VGALLKACFGLHQQALHPTIFWKRHHDSLILCTLTMRALHSHPGWLDLGVSISNALHSNDGTANMPRWYFLPLPFLPW